MKIRKMKMKYYYIYILPLLFIAALISGCSELRTDISEPVNPTFHGPGINNPASDNFHGNLVRNIKWDMRQCESCHGSDLNGGITGASCKTCHNQNESGPKACNTCHGVFADPSRIAPPRDISENISSSLRGVGAHVQHIYDRDLGARVSCSSCHNVPQNIYDPGHMVNDNLPAEVMLKGSALLFGATNAVYDTTNATCSNTYCHGNFTFFRDSANAQNRFAYTSDRMTGRNRQVVWTKVNEDEAECGSCHGIPPEGHLNNGITVNDCYQCHGDVVNENGQIIDKDRHINGQKDVKRN